MPLRLLMSEDSDLQTSWKRFVPVNGPGFSGWSAIAREFFEFSPGLSSRTRHRRRRRSLQPISKATNRKTGRKKGSDVSQLPLLARRGGCAEGADGVVVQVRFLWNNHPGAHLVMGHPSWPGNGDTSGPFLIPFLRR